MSQVIHFHYLWKKNIQKLLKKNITTSSKKCQNIIFNLSIFKLIQVKRKRKKQQ